LVLHKGFRNIVTIVCLNQRGALPHSITMMRGMPLALWLLCIRLIDSSSFLRHMEVHRADAETFLDAEMDSNLNQERIAAFLDELFPLLATLPKSAENRLEHAVVHYVLHRYFIQRNGWWIKGLEPGNGTWRIPDVPEEAEALPADSVPLFLLHRLEAHRAGKAPFVRLAVSPWELAELAAAIEDLVTKESTDKMEALFETLGLPTNGTLAEEEAMLALKVYLTSFVRRVTIQDRPQAERKLAWMAREHGDWGELVSWMDSLESVRAVHQRESEWSIQQVRLAAKEIGEQFAHYNDGDCLTMKAALLEAGERSRKAGRVRLPDFYNKSFSTSWKFTEKVAYLRSLGSLDESDPENPLVIIPNYVNNINNCADSTSLYAVCCRNECEDLLGHIEKHIKAPYATVQQIMELVQGLPSQTVNAPQQLLLNSIVRLESIADAHNGMVPIHGRLFAQWMHHVYPNECPYPHEAGVVNPQTPGEWMRDGGHESAHATDEEMRWVVSSDACPAWSGPCGHTGEDGDLPWSNTEELLINVQGGGLGHVQDVQDLEAVHIVSAAAFLVVGLGAGGWAYKCQKVPYHKHLLVLAATALAIAAALVGLIDGLTCAAEFIIGLMLLKVNTFKLMSADSMHPRTRAEKCCV